MTYASGAACTLAQRCDSAVSRMLLIVGSAAPSGLSRAISSAWHTTGSTLGLASGGGADDEVTDEGVEAVVFGVAETEERSLLEAGFVGPLMP